MMLGRNALTDIDATKNARSSRAFLIFSKAE